MPLLKVENLKTYFYMNNHPVAAVDGVDFSLEEGETLGIVGESGCGKSVTSLSIMGLLPRKTSFVDKESSVWYRGENLLQKSQKQMCKIRGNEIAMIFQDSMTSLNPVMRIGEQMAETFKIHRRMSGKEAEKNALEMLEKVGIPSPGQRMKSYPHQLSGGMRQRIMIAMALSCNPRILIADEPTTALDVTIQAQILDLMRELKDKMKTAIVLITHDLGVVADMADYVLVMYAGHVMEYAAVQDLFREPLHPYTRGLLKSIPRWDKTTEVLYTIAGSVPNLNEMPAGCRFCARCENASERCRSQCPPLYQVGDRKVRCFLYERDGGGV